MIVLHFPFLKNYLILYVAAEPCKIRLEEKMTNLESENKVFRQQAVSMAPNKFLSGRSRSIIQVLLFYMYFLCRILLGME